MKRTIIIVAAVVAAGFGAMAIRVVHEGSTALGDGDDWMLRGKPADAIQSYEAAARWYLPFAPHVGAAYDRLRGLTQTKNDDPTVIAAWRAIRSAARSTRSLWTPHAGDLADADAAIAAMSAREPGAGSGAGNTTRDRVAWYAARLADPAGRAGIGASLLAGLGIVLWVGGAFGLVRRGLDDRGRLVGRPALVAAITIVVGLAGWAVGLYNA